MPSISLTGQITTATFHAPESRKPNVVAAAIWPQLEAQGYELALHCADQTCGGYEFRFTLPVLPPPHMFVDLGDYVFLSGQKNNTHGLWILISRSLSQTHVQLTRLDRPARRSLSCQRRCRHRPVGFWRRISTPPGVMCCQISRSTPDQRVWTRQDSPHYRHSGPCLLYTSPSPRDRTRSRMPSSA